MEDQLWQALYPLVIQEGHRRPRRKRVLYSDAVILLVGFWAVLHDRPIAWACQAEHWPADLAWERLPSEPTMSRRLASVSLALLLEQLYFRLLVAGLTAGLVLVRRMDSRPLVIGGFSKDRDARRGYATGGTARGYKLFAAQPTQGQTLVPWPLVLGPLSESDPAGAGELIDRLPAEAGGYLLADATHDTNPLYEHAAARGFQLLAPRKRPGTDLGHRQHSPARRRAIDLLEGPMPAFGAGLLALREPIERDFGQSSSFGGGLQPLPAWVRHPRRVVRWVLMKLILNGLRICHNKGLAA